MTASQLVRLAGAMKVAAERVVGSLVAGEQGLANVLWLLGDEIEREFTEEADRERQAARMERAP